MHAILIVVIFTNTDTITAESATNIAYNVALVLIATIDLIY